MELSDFEPEMADGQLVPGLWKKRSPIVTSSGEFELNLRVGKAAAPPDKEMFAEVDALVTYVMQHHAAVWNMIFESYLLAGETPGHLKSVGVPAGLTTAQIGPYLGPVTLFVVRKKAGFVSGMQALPRWNEEHGLLFQFSDGQFEPVE